MDVLEPGNENTQNPSWYGHILEETSQLDADSRNTGDRAVNLAFFGVSKGGTWWLGSYYPTITRCFYIECPCGTLGDINVLAIAGSFQGVEQEIALVWKD